MTADQTQTAAVAVAAFVAGLLLLASILRADRDAKRAAAARTQAWRTVVRRRLDNHPTTNQGA